MKFNIGELHKILNYILSNNEMSFGKKLFNRNSINAIREVLNGKKANDIILTNEQKEGMIKYFIKEGKTIDKDTPNFIINDDRCLRSSIMLNPNSVDYIEEFTPELMNKISSILSETKYVLNLRTPRFLREKFAVVKNSINLDVNSADYIEWDSFSEDEKKELLSIVINNGYILHERSCYYLRNNPELALLSIKEDIENVEYTSSSVRYTPDVFKYLLLNGYEYSAIELELAPLESFKDPEVLKLLIKDYGKLDHKDAEYADCFYDWQKNRMDEYDDRLCKLFSVALDIMPSISTFKGIFDYYAEKRWNDYRSDHMNKVANIFGIICAALKYAEDFDKTVEELSILQDMEKYLGDKYKVLYDAMYDYYLLIHDEESKQSYDKVRDKISELSALYVSIRKETYKKEYLDKFYDFIKPNFSLRSDHPVVLKRITERKQKNKLCNLYLDEINNGPKEILPFLSSIADTSNSEINDMIHYFIVHEKSKLEDIIEPPDKFKDYTRYLEAKKLIKRLNSKFIKYTDLELKNYRDIIKHNDNDNCYEYVGPTFSSTELISCNEYSDKKRLFEKIKREIILKAKTLEVDDTVDICDEDIDNNFPFNDEYYKFNEEYFLEYIVMENFYHAVMVPDKIVDPVSILNDKTYEKMTKFVADNGLVWLLLFSYKYRKSNVVGENFDRSNLMKLMDYMVDVVRLSHVLHYDLNDYSDVMKLYDIAECTDDKTLAMLGTDIVYKLCNDQTYTDSNSELILKIARDLVCEMVKRDSSTVPYIKGETENYKYSMYDSLDLSLLLAGINTDACFRINGIDNDFLHYCALDKNGFVIKITNKEGAFVARAAGFRNGNSVFINQLRTIYDVGGDGFCGTFYNELQDIVDAFVDACTDIVRISQNNQYEKKKIDRVFVTKSYALASVEDYIVSREITKKIGSHPMVIDSEDWHNFVSNTKNLEETSEEHGFSTDYGSYNVICIAGIDDLPRKAKDIKFRDVPALYKRERTTPNIVVNPSEEILAKVTTTEGICSHLYYDEFRPITINDNTVLFYGDNWYIIYEDGIVTASRVLDGDKYAKVEYDAAMEEINEYNNKKGFEKKIGTIEKSN